MALGTFKIDSDRWKAFQEKARRDKTTASALIKGFIDSYLDSSIPTRDDRLDRLETQVEELMGKLPALKAF